MKSKNIPSTRLGWSEHFATSYNKNGSPHTAHMALWYFLLHLAFDK